MKKLVPTCASFVLALVAAQAQTATYNGPNTTTNGNTWMTASNWLPSGVGVPAGPVDVVIPASKTAAAWSDTVPNYTGNLTLGTNAMLQMGWVKPVRPSSANAIGTAGSTLITMAQGSRIVSRTGGSLNMPEIILTGDATVNLGSSTEAPSEGVFDFPVKGPYRFTVSTNADGGGVKFNAPNTFKSLVIQGSSGRSGQGMFPVAANVPGAFGLGDVTTLRASDSYTNTPQLQFNAPNVMTITGRLILKGRGPTGNGNNRILMNQSATIGGLVIDGVEQPPGVYTNSSPWLTGPGTLTVLLVSPLNPDPAFGKIVPLGPVNLTWTNETPVTGTDVWSDVWFGTNPASLTKVADKQLNLTSFTVNAPAVGTYYWRVDSYLGGSPDGTPKTGGVYHFAVNDSDSDGMPDDWEFLYTSPQSTIDLAPNLDADSDDLTNLQEFLAGTIPTNPDTDSDGVLDGRETKTGVWVSATNTGTDPLKADTDGDALSDGVETNTGTWASATNTGTNPNNRDSDSDALSDGVETRTGTFVSATNTGTNPNVADTDGDTAGDWYEVFASLTNPTLASSSPGVPYPLPAYDGSPGVSNKPVKVYILAGQSNMVGFGQIAGSSSGTLATMTGKENKFPHIVAPGGGYVTRNDVHYRGVISALGKTGLRPGLGKDATSIGPELGFGHLMGWYHDEPVLIIKASIGNRSLQWDILPVGSQRFDWTNGKTYAGYGDQAENWTTGTTPTAGSWYAGKEFDRFYLAKENWAPAGATDNTQGTGYVLDNFATEYPQWAAQGFQIAGFGWFQGFGDQGEPNTSKYEENLVRKIKYLRTYYENRYPGKVVPNAPYAIATFAVGGFTNQTSGGAKVAQAQINVGGDSGKYPEFAGNVKTMEARHYWRTREQSPPAGEDYHYYWNSETYMLVGDALARAIIEMQDDETPPTPNPMTFEVAPQGAGTGAIAMRATAASDQSMPVEYYFENTTNGNFRDWSTSREWTNTGLTDGQSYGYRVKARDAKSLEGQWSGVLTATAGADTTAPAPNPMTFAVSPTALGETSVTMTAATAIDFTTVEYLFTCTSGSGPNSGWQSSAVFTPTGLNHSTTYTYTVRARDAAGNETAPSAPASATTATPDLIAPTPNPMTFASAPATAGLASITMTASTASDPSGVEYRFNNVTLGTSSPWQDSPAYTATGLSSATSYTFTVQARDKSPAQNITAASAPAAAITATPDTTAPTVVSRSPANGATSVQTNTNLTLTFNEAIQKGTGNIVVRRTDNSAFAAIGVTSASVSVASAVATITLPANLGAVTQYFVEVDAGAFQDLSGNPFAGITGNTSWGFTTNDPNAFTRVTLYSDEFSSGTNTALSGQAPQVRPGTETWRSASATKSTSNGGSVSVSGSMAGHLAMPGIVSDRIYTLTARVFNNNSESSTNWIALGFTAQTSDTAAWSTASTGIYWMLWRGNNEIRGFRGAGATNPIGATSGVVPAGVGNVLDLRVILDTRTAFNRITYQYKNPDTEAWTDYATATLSSTSLASIKSVGFSANSGSVSIQSFELTVDDPRPRPTVSSIEDDQSGNPVEIGVPVTYTLTFNKDLDISTFGTDDFGNAGSATTDLGIFSRLASGVFTVVVTPTTSGTMQFRINQGADLRDTDGLILDTSSARLDDTVLTVTEPPPTGTPFGDWTDGFDELADANPVLDIDKGGLATALEWVLGGNPANPSDDAGLAPKIDTTSDPDGKVLFTFRRRNAARDDERTTITVQYGNSLTGWTAAAHQGNAPNQITITSAPDPGDAGFEFVTVALPPSLSGTGSLFVRLGVNVATP